MERDAETIISEMEKRIDKIRAVYKDARGRLDDALDHILFFTDETEIENDNLAEALRVIQEVEEKLSKLGLLLLGLKKELKELAQQLGGE